ncbi:MAG: hypothetical protein J6W41_04285 [Alphaproteobacteria bacterium]|nr:hypothetical protein [Alphaproteobacteria bacterium]
MTKSDRFHFYIDLATNTVESFRDSADADYTMTYNFGDWQVSISFYQNNIKGGAIYKRDNLCEPVAKWSRYMESDKSVFDMLIAVQSKSLGRPYVNPFSKIQHVVRERYICKVPAGGLYAIKCYPDAITCFIHGNAIGYSKHERTMIVPLGTSVAKIEEYKTILEKHLQERTQQIKR